MFADKCVDQRVVRAFTILKLLLLTFLISAIPFVAGETIDPPTIELPPLEVLTWPVIAGRGTPGVAVEVLHNNQSLGLVEVDADGRWQLVPQPSLAPGTHLLAARAVNDAGEVIAVGREGEGQLNIVGVPTLQLSSGDEEAGRVMLRLSGTGTPASILRLAHNGAFLEPTIVDEVGRWAVSVWVEKPSENEFYVQLLARDGTILGRSGSKRFDIGAPSSPSPPPENGSPAELVVERVRFDDPIRAEALGFIAGWLDVVGSGRPGRVIEIFQEGQLAGQATILPDGRWTLRLFVILLPGEQSYSARMIEVDGSLVGERLFTITIPKPPSLAVEGGQTDADEVELSGQARPNQPVTLFLDGERLGTVQSDNQGSWHYATYVPPGSHEFLALDGTLESDRGELTVDLAVPVILGQSTDASGQLVAGLYGYGRPDTRLEIMQEGIPVGQASVDSDGNWRCHCTLPPGEHTLSVREIEEPERASQPGALQISNPSPAYEPGPFDPEAPPFRCPEDSQPGQITGMLYSIGCGESMSVITTRLGVTPEQLLAYNPQLSDPPQFYFGQTINIPQLASCFDDSDGRS